MNNITDEVTDENRVAELARRIGHLTPAQRALFQQRRSAQRTDGYDAVAGALAECGLTHIYGVAGRPTEEILPACYRRGIRPIGVYRQTAAVCMAVAHNYQAGRLVAAALVSAGPAITNAMTGMMVARDNGWPVLVLGGQRTSFQHARLLPAVRSLTKDAIEVPCTEAIRDCIVNGYQIAVSGRHGPVYLELHEDVLTGNTATSFACSATGPIPTERPPTLTDAEVERIAAALLSAQRPALLLGEGIRWTVVPAELQQLVEVVGMPFITSPMGRGFIPDDHPLCCNMARSLLQTRADAVLILGARLNWVFRHGAEFSPEAKIFHVDIHPDEGDAKVDREFLRADAGPLVSRLLEAVRKRQRAGSANRPELLTEWHADLRMAARRTEAFLESRVHDDRRPMSPFRMMHEVRAALPRNAICVTEGNVSMLVAQQVIPAYAPGARMDAGTNACMGVGIPFAIGAKVAHPDRPVVAVVGDYGFSLSAMEMEVCVRHHIPIVVIVANNQGNNGAAKQRRDFPDQNAELVTMFLPGLEYDRIMKTFGGSGATITDPEQLAPAIRGALGAERPCCLNVVIDPDEPLLTGWGNQSRMECGDR